MLQELRPYLTVGYSVPALLVLFVVYSFVSNAASNNRIRRLGTRAPPRVTYFPWGLDMLYEVVWHMSHDLNYELWVKMFDRWGKGGNTVEAGTGERVILTREPENIKAILATQFKEFGKGEQFHNDFKAFLGNGIFATDGTLWHDSRQLIRPQFIKDRVSDLDIFERHTQILIRKIGEAREVDVLDLMFRLTLDAATDFLMGESVGSLEQPQTSFANAFYRAQSLQSLIARMGPFNRFIPLKRMGFYDSIKTIDNFCDLYIQKALALSPEELEKKSNHDQGYTFLHAIAGHTRDRKVLRDQLVNILLAGRDTTACTLSWTIYELSLQPAIVHQLRQEIIDHVGLEKSPTYENLKNMKYLQHIMNETLRLYPVVPFNVRTAAIDTTLPTGGGKDLRQPIGVPKGTIVGYSPLVMQRCADLFPPPESGWPDISAFVPERWDHWTPKSWTYIPFNGGPRICVGQQFALTEMGYVLVRLFQKFEKLENYMGGEKPGMHADIVLQPAKPVRVGFR